MKTRKKGKRRNHNHGTELAASGNGVFKGRCYICEIWGHKRYQYSFRNRLVHITTKMSQMRRL